MTFKVEKDIPLPEKVYRGRYTAGSVLYPWNDMQVMNSFAVPIHMVNKVRVAAGCINAKGDRYFTVRDTLKGHRCWRIR